MIECELATSHYIADTEIRNEGVTYADSFYIATRYCLVQVDRVHSSLKVTSEVKYVKSIMGVAKCKSTGVCAASRHSVYRTKIGRRGVSLSLSLGLSPCRASLFARSPFSVRRTSACARRSQSCVRGVMF
jgi:hypothetical protein